MRTEQIIQNNGDVIFYHNYHGQIYDISVRPGVKEVTFTASGIVSLYQNYCPVFKLKNVKKQFPDVERLMIDKSISGKNLIILSNFMFPNVKYIYSSSEHYESGSVLKEKSFNNIKLCNTFCKKADEIIDLSGVTIISKDAFAGCQSTHVIQTKQIKSIDPAAFDGSAFALNGRTVIADTLLIVANESNACIDIPSNITRMAFLGPLNPLRIRIQNLSQLSLLPDRFHTRKLECEIASQDFIEPHKLVSFSSGLISFVFPENHPYYMSIGGAVYTKDKKRLIVCSQSCTGSFDVPEGVEVIGRHAFLASQIKEIHLPQSLKKIDDLAFARAKNLKAVTGGDSLISIGNSSFFECASLDTMPLPETLRFIGDSAFSSTALKTVHLPAHLLHVGNCSFSGVTAVSMATYIPGSLAALYSAPVHNDKCEGHYPIRLQIGDVVTYIDAALSSSAQEIDMHLSAFPDDEKYIRQLYLYTPSIKNPVSFKVELAVMAYKEMDDKNNEDTKKYLARVGKTYCFDLIRYGMKSELIAFLELHLLSASALKALLKQTETQQLTTESSYLMQELKNLNKTSTFRL